MSEVILRIEGLNKVYRASQTLSFKKKELKAVDDVSFEVYKGECFGVVGESGCGKSTLGRCLLRLIEPTSGKVEFLGSDISKLGRREMKKLRRKMQIIFQDPYSSLNPKMRVGDIIGAALDAYNEGTKIERKKKVLEIMNKVGLAESSINKYPSEFSGGQRQRIMIARALVIGPEFVVGDEPVSALDVYVRAQILNLMKDLQDEMSMTYFFISHDLSVVKHMSDRIAVMYMGQIVELAGKDEIYNSPRHPYTDSVLKSIPLPDPENKVKRIELQGEIPSGFNPPKGCKFHTRCPYKQQRCCEEEPILKKIGETKVRCHYPL